MQNEIPSNAAGPGAVVDSGIEPEALLDKVTEEYYVTVFNPLSVDFYGAVGMSRPTDVPFQIHKDGVNPVISNNENDVRNNYGVGLKNQYHPAKAQLVNKVVVPSGKTVNLPGNEAQVVVRQLVNEIMQREGNKIKIADKFERSKVEKRVVKGVHNIREMQNVNIESVQSQLYSAVDKLNHQESQNEHEVAFPSLKQNSKPTPKPNTTGKE